MSILDDARNKTEDVMNDISPEQKEQIEQIARDKGISIEEARDHLFTSQDKDKNLGQQEQSS